MERGTENAAAARAQFVKARGAYESALKLEPDYREAALYLVDLHASLPENMGGERGLRSAFFENAAKRQSARATIAIEKGSTVASDQIWIEDDPSSRNSTQSVSSWFSCASVARPVS